MVHSATSLPKNKYRASTSLIDFNPQDPIQFVAGYSVGDLLLTSYKSGLGKVKRAMYTCHVHIMYKEFCSRLQIRIQHPDPDSEAESVAFYRNM